MQKNIYLLLIVCAISPVFSQQFKGSVVNTSNEPLEDVYLINNSSNTHAHTDKNGVFLLPNTKENDLIKISILGYKKRTLLVTEDILKNGIVLTLETKIYQLEELVLRKDINALQTIANIDLQINPVNNSQEILRKIPGLFIGQHAGGGKAEQIFLRGFDIDHGTDISLSFDGMPINMVSHAHGQGYSDLHFIIPETIKTINFDKGPYAANLGDFSTAGYVSFSSKDKLQKKLISLESGQFNSQRVLGMFNFLAPKNGDNAYVALEYIATDGPFESPQNFSRINIFGKYNAFINENDKISLTASHFTSTWDASGQIPKREVDAGNITRFGAIDDTEGGTTSRTNINLEFHKQIAENTLIKSNVFYTNYNFELFSNFTFFLEDPINGDQIKQSEDRAIFGANTQMTSLKELGSIKAQFEKGAGIRYDLIDDIELSRTKNRKELLENIQLGEVRQTNLYAFYNASFQLGKLKIALALRLDYFNFQYNDDLNASYETLTKTKAILNPKLNFLYTQNNSFQWFLKSGIGFHSNDARLVLQQDADKILPRAYGLDIGNIWKPSHKVALHTTLWYLFSEEEFVYVGDAGIVEPSGESERLGIDVGIRYQLLDWLYLDTDATYTKARSLEHIKGEDFIPLAPDLTLAGGVSFTNLGNFSGGLRYRYLDDRPANEDNSILAEGYFVTDFNMNYKIRNTTFGIQVQNLFDVDWNETQFATNSRLQNEASAVEEIHFTPGTPFFFKASITYQF